MAGLKINLCGVCKDVITYTTLYERNKYEYI